MDAVLTKPKEKERAKVAPVAPVAALAPEAPATPPVSAKAPEPQAPHPLLEGLNAEQRAAVTHDAGPLLIVAGAGTGKTTVVSRRIAWLIETGRAKPDEILALTFTEKAAGEMTERVDALLPLGYTDLWISTFHAFCRRVIEERGLDIGVPNEFRLLDSTDAYLLVRRNLDRFKLDYYKPLGNPTKFLHAMLRHFSRAKDEDISPEEYYAYAQGLAVNSTAPETTPEIASESARQRELAEAYHVYQRLLLEEGSLDLGDLQMYALRLLRTRPQVLAEFRKRFKYVMVDEFQDTNWAQYELIKMIVGGAKNDGSQGGGNVVVVGDDDQSIYKFRGASVSNILQFKGDFGGAREVVLTANYRSLQGILDASYGFIQRNNPNRLEAKLTTSDGRPLVKRLSAAREGEATIEHLRYATHEDEVAGVVSRIVEMKAADPEREWTDFCILVRSNGAADDYSRALQRRGVPYQFLALRGLYAKPVIMDCTAYFMLLDDHHESTAFYRMLSSPPYAIDAHDLMALAHHARKTAQSMYAVAQKHSAIETLSAASREKIDRLLSGIARHAQMARTRPVTQLLVSFLTESGYLSHLKGLDDGKAREQFGYLHQFLDRLKRFEESHDDATLRHFNQEFAIERESGEEGSLAFDPDTGPDMVRIMTIHASKGLEFTYVFIVDLVDKRFPTVARGGEIPVPDALTKEILPEGGDLHLEEERRLMYVAMTRAKDGLFLTSAEDYGGKTKKKPSLFLAELGFDAVLVGAPAGERLVEPAPAVEAPPREPSLPPYFSFTQLAAYDTCPLQYKFAHVIRIPSLGKGAQSFGKTMHACLEWLLGTLAERDAAVQGTLPGATLETDAVAATITALTDTKSAGRNAIKPLSVSQDELLTKYDEVWIDDWYESPEKKEEFREKGRAMLSLFYQQCEAEPPQPKHLEQDFSLKIGQFVVKGQIDRIDALAAEAGLAESAKAAVGDDATANRSVLRTVAGESATAAPQTVEIIDYKTGRPKTEEQLAKSGDAKKQLYLYQIAVTRLLGLTPVKLTFHYLEDGTRVSFLGSEKQLGKFEGQVEETLTKIRSGLFEATPGRHCEYCDFKEICDYRE